MKIYSEAFHTSYQYSLASAFPEIQWYFLNGVWMENRPKPSNVSDIADIPFENFDIYLAHWPAAFWKLRERLDNAGIDRRKLIYISHWAYQPEIFIHVADGRSLDEFRHDVAQHPIVSVSHFMVQDFGFYSHIINEVVPHYVPAHLFQDYKWSDSGEHYINIVNAFMDKGRGVGADFWMSLQDVPKKIYGNNGDFGEGPIATLSDFGRIVSGAKAYLWTGDGVAMSFAPLEAMLCGCPVIAPDNMDWAKMFEPGREVLLFEPNNIESLKSVLEKFESSPELRHDLSRHGAEAVRKKNSIQQFRARWSRVIDAAMSDY